MSADYDSIAVPRWALEKVLSVHRKNGFYGNASDKLEECLNSAVAPVSAIRGNPEAIELAKGWAQRWEDGDIPTPKAAQFLAKEFLKLAAAPAEAAEPVAVYEHALLHQAKVYVEAWKAQAEKPGSALDARGADGLLQEIDAVLAAPVSAPPEERDTSDKIKALIAKHHHPILTQEEIDAGGHGWNDGYIDGLKAALKAVEEP